MHIKFLKKEKDKISVLSVGVIKDYDKTIKMLDYMKIKNMPIAINKTNDITQQNRELYYIEEIFLVVPTLNDDACEYISVLVS